MPDASPYPASSRRIASLDQFRGYTVAGMLLVNFIGSYEHVHEIFKHRNNYCSYADTIMPQFFFAVGFAYRLTFLRRLAQGDAWGAVRAVLKRNAGLILLGFVLYHLDGRFKSWSELESLGIRGFFATAFKREVFQTLVHIALASIWVLPVIALSTRARVLFLIATAALHFGLSWLFYFDWAWKVRVIDGGPLGFVSWAIPILVGSLAYDRMVDLTNLGRTIVKLLGWSIVLMAAGYGIACLGPGPHYPPFVQPPKDFTVDLYTMSQRDGSISYQIFAAGFSLAVYALFVGLCDVLSLRSSLFRIFGQNALAAYIIHGMVASAVKPFVPDNVPLWYLVCGFSLYFGICALFNSHLEKQKLFLKL